MRLCSTAAVAVLATACQPITVEPDAGPPANHPPRIVEGFASPPTVTIDGFGSTDGCTTSMQFSIGKVEDDDIDQDVQEHWVVDYDPSLPGPTLGETLTLTQLDTQPAFRTDPPNAFVLTGQKLKTLDARPVHTVDVYISDGFDYLPADGGVSPPDAVKPGYFLVRHSWVIYMSQECPP